LCYIYCNLNNKATFFKFVSYKFEPTKKRIVFNYKIEFKGQETIVFTEVIILPKVPKINDIPKEVIEKLLESLHLVLGVSYYKSYCATKVRLKYKLSKKEADFWNKIYKNGLGEFFYQNKLDPKISPKFPFIKKTNQKIKNTKYRIQNTNSRCLVGIGGGKDSIISTEILKADNFDITGFIVETGKKYDLIEKVSKTIGVNNLNFKRILDEKIYDKHKYDGHIPISAIYAFLGVFSAVLYRYSYFIVSNEHSSNFGSMNYRGLEINHQWSKSFEFEKLLKDYLDEFIKTDVKYFSLLRPFYEIRIVEMFSKKRKYFPYFSSCNSNFKLESNSKKLWCDKCPKCVFVFILMSAFLDKKTLINIFGENLYKNRELLSLFKDVLGFGNTKPLDCVGTFEESQSAMFLAKNKFAKDFIMRQLSGNLKFSENIFKTQKENLVPESFKFLGMKNVLILGYGKEGKITEKYLKKYYPNLKIGITDEKQNKNYLNQQENFDIAIRTPGIKKELLQIPYTTATNIFFSKVLGKNLIIGVTGSKGKSTVSSLIYEILKVADKNVVLVGNIGRPMLQELLGPVSKNRIFILELSSYQLDDISFSPDIAVITSLFPEHMDYHDSLKNYYEAKKNIIKFQNQNNFFVYNPKNKGVKNWLKNYKGRAVKLSTKNLETNLVGEHNRDNINSAVSVAKILNISDEVIKKAVKNFKGLPHRLEFVGEFKGIKFYDDAISTTPDSTIMAIESLSQVDTIFLGGEDRGYDFRKLEKIIKKHKIRNIVLFPNSGNNILKSKKGYNVLNTKNMEEAVRFAYQNTTKDKICLLSCASPSYSLWENFEEKGNQFKKYILKWANT